MGRASLRAGDGLRHRSGAGACAPAPRCQDAGGLQPDLLTVRVRCRPRHEQRRRLGREQDRMREHVHVGANKYKKAGTCA